VKFNLKYSKWKGPWWFKRVSSGLGFQKGPKDWQTRMIIPRHNKGHKRECTNYQHICLAHKQAAWKKCHKLIETKLGDTMCGFRSGHCIMDQSFTLQQTFNKKSWMYVKDVYARFVDLGKHLPSSFVKRFGEYCKSKILRTSCYWSSSHCIPAQKFVSMSVVVSDNS